MQRIASHLVQPLRQNKYLIGYGEGIVVIKSQSWNPKMLIFISPVVAVGLIWAGLDYKFFLLGLLVFLVPLLYDRWKFPKKVSFDSYAKSVNIHTGLSGNSIDFVDVVDLYAEKSDLWSDVSAFQEGNKDYIYKVFLTTRSGKTHRLIRLQFRNECDAVISELTMYLKTLKSVL